MNVYIVNGSAQYSALFKSFGHKIVSNDFEADFAVFTGGEDVSPNFYGDIVHRYTSNSEIRDHYEAEVFNYFWKTNVPMVGICRGAQFLNVMSGGRMYQHVENHTRSHAITDVITGETVYVSSTHHQMMMPSPDGVLVAYSSLHGSREWFDGQIAKRDVADVDNEVVFYPNTKCLCFQPHPEFIMPEYEGMRMYFGQCLEKYLGVK